MSADFPELLKPILSTGDVEAAWELLDGLSGEELRAAKEWFGRSRRLLRELHGFVEFAGDRDQQHQAWNRDWYILGMCAVRLCGPKAAAGRVPWGQYWDYKREWGEALLVQMLWEVDRPWAAEFVEAASSVSLGSDARSANEAFSRVLRAVAIHHQLPCPTGNSFLKHWWAGLDDYEGLEAKLRADPFLPEVLFLYLASGECRDQPQLPEAIAALCNAELIDRDALIEHILQLLTTSQAPKSQLVLGRILVALGLRSSEVRGGLDYLLGVLSTCDRSVVPLLLPRALELVDDPPGLAQLANVITARPEKKPLDMLLAALKTPDLQSRCGLPAVVDALGLLADTEDAERRARVEAVARKLNVDVDHRTEVGDKAVTAPPATVLWDLDPTPAVLRDRALDLRIELSSVRVTWTHPQPVPDLADSFLSQMHRGSFDGPAVVDVATSLMELRRFHAPRFAQVMEEMFVAGGLRQGWPVALAVADAACSSTRHPARLAHLLRTLARFAGEVPATAEVPDGIAILASSKGTTKAQVEARVLAAALTRDTIEDVLKGLSASDPAPQERMQRGLWRLTPLIEPSPSERPFGRPGGETVDLLRLREGLSRVPDAGRLHRYKDVCLPHSNTNSSTGYRLTDPDRVLSVTLRAIREHGVDAVRHAVEDIVRIRPYDKGEYPPIAVATAIDAWAAGTLDEKAFWRIATGPTVTQRHAYKAWLDAGLTNEETRVRRDSQPATLHQRLAQPDDDVLGALVLPDGLCDVSERLMFFHAAEALLRGTDDRALLSTPSWSDATIEFADLACRLNVAALTPSRAVGPIDLVLALHRLRPVDPSLADQIPDGLVADPAFIQADGEESWDASDLVRSWIMHGGLPALKPSVDADGHWTGLPTAPLPLSRLAPVVPELAEEEWRLGWLELTLMVTPRWPDRVAPSAYLRSGDEWDFPSHACAPWGLPLHDLLLRTVTPQKAGDWGASTVLVDAARRGKIVPEMAAKAAIGRHGADTLRLGYLTVAIRLAFEAGALRGLWASALAIADRLCDTAKRPPALTDLLKTLTDYVYEVPPEELGGVPPRIRAYAIARGSSKMQGAARELVATLETAGAQ